MLIARALSISMVAFVALGPSFALAQSEASTRMTRGEELFDAGNFEAALVEFETAYEELEGNPDRYLLLFNIAHCYERTFRYERALTYYRQYLAEGGASAEGAADVEATMRALEGLLGTLEIRVDVPHAVVWVDGLEIGTAPGTILVPGGVHRVELRAEGYVSELREVQVAARQTQTLSFELAALSTYAGIDPLAFAITASVAGATLLAGVVTGGVALAGAQSAHDDGYPNTVADAQRVNDAALAADVLYAAGGAIAIAAVVLAFVTDWSSHAADAQLVAIPTLGPREAGLSLSGTF